MPFGTGTVFTTPIDATRDDLMFSTVPTVAEPPLMALLGIGIASFFTCRRLFSDPPPFDRRAKVTLTSELKESRRSWLRP